MSLISVFHYTAQNSYSLEVNNIKARVNNNIHLFNKNDVQESGFESVLTSYTNTIYNSSLWLAGEYGNGNLSVAAEKSYDVSSKDFFFGPIGNYYNLPNYQNYDRVYPITKTDIDQHNAWYNCVQDPNCDVNINFPNYTIPQYILEWPAHGDVSNGEDFYLAPFEDVDGDGIYNPENGDYPKIKGDEAVFYVLNDFKTHVASGGAPLGVEIHVMVYAYESNLEVINNTVFVNYKVFNRGKVAGFSKLKIGVYTDLDVDYFTGQDFIGCDTNRNMYYGYTVNTPNDTLGEPAQGVKFLNKTMNSFTYYTSSTGSMGDPNNGVPAQFNNYLSSKWKDGSSLYYGGNGYFGNTGVSSVETNYAFSGNPSGLNGWSQDNQGDMRGVGVIEEQNFNPHDMICFDLAYIFNLDKTVSNLENVNQLLTASDEVQNFYDNNQLGCDYLFTSVEEKKEELIKPLVYPNPFSEETKVLFNREIVEGKLGLLNSLGQKVKSFELKNRKELTISREGLAEGVYFYQISDTKGIIFTGKLIIK